MSNGSALFLSIGNRLNIRSYRQAETKTHRNMLIIPPFLPASICLSSSTHDVWTHMNTRSLMSCTSAWLWPWCLIMITHSYGIIKGIHAFFSEIFIIFNDYVYRIMYTSWSADQICQCAIAGNFIDYPIDFVIVFQSGTISCEFIEWLCLLLHWLQVVMRHYSP